MIRASFFLLLTGVSAWAQTQTPDLRGIWQASGNAHLNLENKGVIVDPANGKIPYKAEAGATSSATSRIAPNSIRCSRAFSLACRARRYCRSRSRSSRTTTASRSSISTCTPIA